MQRQGHCLYQACAGKRSGGRGWKGDEYDPVISGSRGYSAADTIGRWPSVRRGEKTWIFPNQDHADIFFNSALVYELAALKTLAFPLLLQVEPGTPERIEANRLRAFLQWFDPVDINLIPDNSLLREFVGGSVLEDFQPWVD